MKSPLAIALLVSGGLGIGALAASAIAQTPASPPSTQQPQSADHSAPAFEMDSDHLFERMSRFSPEDRAAFFDARVAAVHAGLHLTPDQEKLWPALEGATRDAMKTMNDERQRLGAIGPATNPVDRLQRIAERATLRGQVLKKVADAAQPFYASLSDEQKHRLPVLMHAGHSGWRQRVGMWMRRHGWGGGRDGGGGGLRQGGIGAGDRLDFGRGGERF